MKKTLYKFRFFLPIYLLLSVGLIIVGSVSTNFTLIAPALNDNINTTINVPSEYESEGSFYTTSVISLDKTTILQKYLGDLLFKVDIKERGTYYSVINESELKVMNVLMKDDSIQSSLIVGIEHSGKAITYDSYPTVYLTYKHLTEDSLQIGDYILSINDNSDIYTETQNLECHESAEFKIIRDGEFLSITASKNEIDDYCSFGIYIDQYSEIIDTEVEYEVYETNTGGPSGGFMQSLYVFDRLTEKDYSYGLKIGGTGTIDVFGNAGSIGGVRQKIITAIGNNIDIFFIPHLSESENDNYIKALQTMEEFESDMILVGVANFDDAISYLQEYGENNE